MLASYCKVNQLKLKECKLKDIYNTDCKKYNVTRTEKEQRKCGH